VISFCETNTECVDVHLRMGREFDFTVSLLMYHMTSCTLLSDLNSGVQHPVARVSIRFINVTTVRNYFYFSLAFI
jgi:hypothetical protein